MARGKGVTIRDVARRARVSTAAVSMALNGTGTLSDATRRRVRAVADEMEYQADALARGLRGAPVGVIGLVIRSLDALGEYAPEGVDVFAHFMGATSAQAMARGLSLMLVPDPARKPSPPLAFGLDGYIVNLPHVDDPVIGMLERRGIPYVTLGRDPSRPDFTDWVSEDDTVTTQRILAHFVVQGARTVGLVRGTDPNGWNIDSEAVYRRWCRRHRVEPVVHCVAERQGVSGGRAVAARIAADGVPDAVLCLTGRHAAGLLLGLSERGVRIPEDTMIATASDSEHARHSRPAISALELNPLAESRALLDLLQARIAGQPSAGPITTTTKFRIRASTRRRGVEPSGGPGPASD